jgi:hypothetical protein
VLAKLHHDHGTQSALSMLPSQDAVMFPHSPLDSCGLVQKSRSLEETWKPSEVDILMSEAVESVESRTHVYPHAEGAALTYPIYHALRELFKDAMFGLPRMREHKFDPGAVISSSKGALRAVGSEEQREGSLSQNVTRRGGLHSSKDRVRTFYADGQSATRAHQSTESSLRESKERDLFAVRLDWDRDDTGHFMEKTNQSYHECFGQLPARRAGLDDGTCAVLTSKFVLSFKSTKFSTLAWHHELKVKTTFAYKQHLDIRKHFVAECLIRPKSLQSRLRVRAIRKKAWRRRWESYVKKMPSIQDVSENKQGTMANIALHKTDAKEQKRHNRNMLCTPLFGLVKQWRRREKPTLQGHLRPIVNIPRSLPPWTLSNINTSLLNILRILDFEENFGDVKPNDVTGRDKGIHDQRTRHSTRSSLTQFTPSSRMQAPYTAVCYAENPVTRRDSARYESGATDNGHSQGNSDLTEGATTACDNNTPNEGNQSSFPNNDMPEDPEQFRDEEWENEASSESDADGESENESELDEEQELHVPLSFQIPEDTLRKAMQSSSNSQASFYSHRLYRGPEDQMLSVHYCRNMEVAERVAKLFVDKKVLGFDIEWKPWASPKSIKDNASLVQIASEDRIALFHISLFQGETPEELLPPTLKTILQSPDIIKVGVAIKGDFTRLQNHLGVQARGVFEISRLHNIVEHHASPNKITKRLVSLARQTQQHLQLPLSKGDVRESDWSKELDKEQIQYAATDAYAGLRIFDVLEAKRKKLRPTPPLPGLCDSDERTTRRVKTAPELVATKEEEEMPNSMETLEQEEDTAEYETASEDFMDSHDLDAATGSGSMLEYLSESDIPDADYVPPHQRVSQASLEPIQPDNAAFNPPPKTRRIGRVALSRLKGVDPGYPRLPQISSDVEDESDSSDAFDPPPQTHLRRRAAKDALLGETVEQSDNGDETDEFADMEVEELMLAMKLDDVFETQAKQSATTSTQLDEVKQISSLSVSDTILEQNEDGERIVASPSETTPTIKEKKKRKLSTVKSTSTDDTTLAPPQPKPPTTDTSPRSSEYTLAETWAQDYFRSTIPSPSTSPSSTSPPSRIRAAVPHMRAYHLWHHQGLPLDEVAGHLRDPPLAISTVLNYVAQAVDLERLEYRTEDMRVVLAGLPLGLRIGRYRRLVERVNGRARVTEKTGWF